MYGCKVCINIDIVRITLIVLVGTVGLFNFVVYIFRLCITCCCICNGINDLYDLNIIFQLIEISLTIAKIFNANLNVTIGVLNLSSIYIYLRICLHLHSLILPVSLGDFLCYNHYY